MIKPLDGSPFMSDNCWNAIIDAVKERSFLEEEIRCLEWGSGNSTINLLRTALNLNLNFKMISVDHETNFFPWLAESVINEFFEKTGKKPSVSWSPLKGPMISLRQFKKVLSERNKFKCSSLYWQIILNNKRLQYIEGYQPNFKFSFIKTIKQIIKLIFIELDYWFWIIKGVIYGFFLKEKSSERYQLNEPIVINNFFDYFNKNQVSGCLKIQQEKICMELWHIPKLQMFWRYELLLDGPITQLPDYVNIPVEGKFDIIFIDGRARVSCAKRVNRDNLLKGGGWLFVHDAFRSEMMEVFRMFSRSLKFINGSNKTLNGNKRCSDDFGPPLIQTGDSLYNLNKQIIQELFVYQNNHEIQNN